MPLFSKGSPAGDILVGVRDLFARVYFIPGRTSQRGVVGRRRSVSHVVRPGLEQTSGVSHRDGFRQPYSNFSNRPQPLAQNRGTILMGIVLWRVTENPEIAILGLAKTQISQKKIASRHQAQRRKFRMSRMDAPSKVSMKGIGVSSKRSCQRPEMTQQVQKPWFWGQFRTQALTVGPCLIGASPVWAARNSYWRSRGYLFEGACL